MPRRALDRRRMSYSFQPQPCQAKNTKASAQTALSKQWPVARELYIFTDGQPTGEVKALVDYLLDPGKGQKSVREVGYVPLAH